MWKHRAYAKAVIRQKEVKLKSSEQLIYLLLADHANADTSCTYFTTSRLCDMTQCARNTVRAGIRKLEKEKLISCLYTPGKSPTYSVLIPIGFDPGASDTSISTVSRAYVPTTSELAAASLEAALLRCGITAEEMATMVYTGIEGMTQEEAKTRAEGMFKDPDISPGFAIIEQLGIARNTPVGRSDSQKALQRERAMEQAERLRKSALAEQRAVWELPRAGESQEAWETRVKAGFQGTYKELLAYRRPDYTAQGH